MIPEFCTDQPFDGSILGAAVWRLNDAGRTADAVSAASSAGVGLMFYRGPSDRASDLEPHGFRRVETLVTFEGELPAGPAPSHVRRATTGDANAVASIAHSAFRTDRWHADPLIPDDRADEFKAAWARNDTTGRADAVLLAYAADGAVAGFNAILLRGDVAVIDLIAVAPGHQGHGMGRALIQGMGAFLPSARSVRVGTQAANAASLKLYASFGWREVSRADTWHWVP